jgi:hypothetical protein
MDSYNKGNAFYVDEDYEAAEQVPQSGAQEYSPPLASFSSISPLKYLMIFSEKLVTAAHQIASYQFANKLLLPLSAFILRNERASYLHLPSLE